MDGRATEAASRSGAGGRGVKMVRIGVTDNGIGMTREVQRRALDLFFTTKSRSMGTGLGLPLARKVALRAGGELTLTSRPRVGTTVTLLIPAATNVKDLSTGAGGRARVAVLKVGNARVSALIWQVLLGAGMKVRRMGRGGPGHADLWVTDPTDRSHAIARRWRRGGGKGVIALVGEPHERLSKAWMELGAGSLGPCDDMRLLRENLGSALNSETKEAP